MDREDSNARQSAEQRLNQNKVVAKRLEMTTAVCMITFPFLTFGINLIALSDSSSPLLAKVAAASIVGVIEAWLGVQVLAELGRKAVEKWAPTESHFIN